jgi:hypothetical protein
VDSKPVVVSNHRYTTQFALATRACPRSESLFSDANGYCLVGGKPPSITSCECVYDLQKTKSYCGNEKNDYNYFQMVSKFFREIFRQSANFKLFFLSHVATRIICNWGVVICVGRKRFKKPTTDYWLLTTKIFPCKK